MLALRALKNTGLAAAVVCACSGLWSACSDTETYADLVKSEKSQIKNFLGSQGIDAIGVDDDWVSDVTKRAVTNGEDPRTMLNLNQWYTVTNGDFNRLYFKIKSWGNVNEEDLTENRVKSGYNMLVRYDSCYNLSEFVDFETTDKGDNMDPNSYEIIYNWNTSYYASTYYSLYYSTGSSYECTSAGLAFPLRFLWTGGEVALIVPFSLGSTTDQSYYLTCYYGLVRYTRPHFLPE